MRALVTAEIKDSFPLLEEMILYQLNTSGKGLRPRIICSLVGIEEGIPFATAVELIHNASLVHDDIQDRDVLRRNQESAWKKFGTDQAILLGDALFSLAFSVLSGKPKASKLVPLLSETVFVLASGQSEELASDSLTLESYERIARQKTGGLFSATLAAAAILAEKDASRASVLGTELGLLFQITDDLIDALGLKDGREHRSSNEAVSIVTILGDVKKVREHYERVERGVLAMCNEVPGFEPIRNDLLAALKVAP